jgi:hypothetical protein
MLGKLMGGWFEAALFVVGLVVVVYQYYAKVKQPTVKAAASTGAGTREPVAQRTAPAPTSFTTKDERRAARAAAGGRMGDKRTRKKTVSVAKPGKKSPHPETDKVRWWRWFWWERATLCRLWWWGADRCGVAAKFMLSTHKTLPGGGCSPLFTQHV